MESVEFRIECSRRSMYGVFEWAIRDPCNPYYWLVKTRSIAIAPRAPLACASPERLDHSRRSLADPPPSRSFPLNASNASSTALMASLPKQSFEPHAREQQPVESVSALPSASSPPSTASPSSVASPRNSASLPVRRSHLGFLRRSRSGDPVRMPVVAPSPPPKLPDLPVNAASPTDFPAHLLRDDERTSVDILTGTLDEPARNGVHKSTDLHAALGGFVPGRMSSDSVIGPSGEYLKSSPLPITEDPYANVGSMAHRGRYSYASSAVSTLNSPRRVRRRKDPTPFKYVDCLSLMP